MDSSSSSPSECSDVDVAVTVSKAVAEHVPKASTQLVPKSRPRSITPVPWSRAVVRGQNRGIRRHWGPQTGEIPPYFGHPQEIKMKTMADFITPGDVKVCEAPVIYHPSEFCLILSNPKLWPYDFYAFVKKMNYWYNQLFLGPGRSEWVASKENISIGSIVVVWQPDEEEWSRAKITKISRNSYTVFLIDYGSYKEYEHHKVYYLLNKFASEPPLIVRCRAQLSSFYDKYHEGREEWSQTVIDSFFNGLKGKEIIVRFIKKDADSVWEVSLERFVEFLQFSYPEIPIQQQVLREAMGAYKEDDEEEGAVTAGGSASLSK